MLADADADGGSDWFVRTDTRKYFLVNAGSLCSSWYDGWTVPDSMIDIKLEYKNTETMNVTFAEPGPEPETSV